MHYFSAMCDESTVVLAAESDRDAVVFPTNITFFTVPVNEPPPLTFYRLPSGIDETAKFGFTMTTRKNVVLPCE